MKRAILFLILALTVPGFVRAEDPVAVEQRVTADLQQILSRVLGEDQFLVQVMAKEDRRMEKQLVEGENLVQQVPQTQVEVPPLPGFTVEPRKPESPPGTSRQVFRMVERVDIKSVSATITMNEALDEGLRKRAEAAARSYLSSRFGAIASLQVVVMPMRISPKDTAAPSWFRADGIPFALAVLALAGIALLWWTRRKEAAASRVRYPTVEGIHDADFQEMPGTLKDRQEGGRQTPLLPGPGGARPLPLAFDERKTSAHQKAAEAQRKGLKEPAFPPIPAREQFTDRRTELLNSFLAEAGIFRNYFDRLSPGAKSELYAGLRGPAFDSLLESLDLVPPQGADTSSPPSEEQMLFYLKNFSEFISSHTWQKQQFFGFLGQMSLEQLVPLALQQNALVNAIMLKYMKPQQAAFLLDRLPAELRAETLAQIPNSHKVAGAELFSIEKTVRTQVENMPGFLAGDEKNGTDFWAKILAHSDRQDEILLDLERSSPELYPSLAKFRFKLDDIPALPKPLIQRVLNDVENDALALALLTCSEDVVNFVLTELPVARRQLLEDQMNMMTGMTSSKTLGARSSLVKRFREVMA